MKFEHRLRIKLDVVDSRFKEVMLVHRAEQRILAQAEPTSVVLRHHNPLRVNEEARDDGFERLPGLIRLWNGEVDLTIGYLKQLEPCGTEHLLGQSLARKTGLREIREQRIACALLDGERAKLPRVARSE